MPCSYDPSPAEIRASEKERADRYQAKLDALTHEADMLRELVIQFAQGDVPPKLPAKVLSEIKKRQTAHRKEDLTRLEKVFIETKDSRRLELVWSADPKKPLEPQLGFDPDSF